MADRITPDFKQMVTDYIEACEQLTAVNKKTKGLRDLKKTLEDQIKNYMIDTELFNLDLEKAGTLSITTKKKVPKMTKQDITDVLLETVDDEDHRDTIVDKMFPDEPEEVTKLQRKKANNKK